MVETLKYLTEECPICFLSYPALNRSKCCGKGICTECFLQLKVSKGSSNRKLEQCSCPFCKTEKYDVMYSGQKSGAEKEAEMQEERKVKEARQRWLEEERKRDVEIARRRSSASMDTLQTSTGSTPTQSSTFDQSQENMTRHSEDDSQVSSSFPSSAERQRRTSERGVLNHQNTTESVHSSERDLPTNNNNSYNNQSHHGSRSLQEQHQDGTNSAVGGVGVGNNRQALGILAEYIPSQLFAMNSEMDLDIDDLMLNQAIFESLVNQDSSPGQDQQQTTNDAERLRQQVEQIHESTSSANDGDHLDIQDLEGNPTLLSEQEAAIRIQRSFRRRASEREATSRQQQHIEQQRNEAATKIQTQFRKVRSLRQLEMQEGSDALARKYGLVLRSPNLKPLRALAAERMQNTLSQDGLVLQTQSHSEQDSVADISMPVQTEQEVKDEEEEDVPAEPDTTDEQVMMRLLSAMSLSADPNQEGAEGESPSLSSD